MPRETPHGKAGLELREVSKFFGDLEALKKIRLRIEPGDSLLLYGPNGAGKTTLLRVLATLSRPSEGQVLFGGEDIYRNPGRTKAAIGFVSHATFLYGELTAFVVGSPIRTACADTPTITPRAQAIFTRADSSPSPSKRTNIFTPSAATWNATRCAPTWWNARSNGAGRVCGDGLRETNIQVSFCQPGRYQCQSGGSTTRWRRRCGSRVRRGTDSPNRA